MEYSKALSKAAIVLLPPRRGHIRVFEHYDPDRSWWVISTDIIRSDSTKYSGSASGSSRMNCFFRACIEAGESEIAKARMWNSRTGVAGGFLARTAFLRAKCELLERDAFLHHYRYREPFKLVQDHQTKSNYRLFEMNSADPTVSAFIAVSSELDGCLRFGLGASVDRQIGITRAIEELRVMELDHQIRTDYCKALYDEKIEAKNLPDFHHAQSRDPRNLNLFVELMNSTSRFQKRVVKLDFDMEYHYSSLRFVKFVRVTCKDLLGIEFGKPEIGTEDKPLYHPLW